MIRSDVSQKVVCTGFIYETSEAPCRVQSFASQKYQAKNCARSARDIVAWKHRTYIEEKEAIAFLAVVPLAPRKNI